MSVPPSILHLPLRLVRLTLVRPECLEVAVPEAACHITIRWVHVFFLANAAATYLYHRLETPDGNVDVWGDSE